MYRASISALSLPAGAVGGDWYDFIPFTDGRWGLVLADVSGKGTAALLMSATRGMLRSLAESCCTPGGILTKLNSLPVEASRAKVCHPGVCRSQSGHSNFNFRERGTFAPSIY